MGGRIFGKIAGKLLYSGRHTGSVGSNKAVSPRVHQGFFFLFISQHLSLEGSGV